MIIISIFFVTCFRVGQTATHYNIKKPRIGVVFLCNLKIDYLFKLKEIYGLVLAAVEPLYPTAKALYTLLVR